jgi:hypothetical protein
MYRFRIQEEHSNDYAVGLPHAPFPHEEAQNSMITMSTAIYAYYLLQNECLFTARRSPTLHAKIVPLCAIGVAFLV